MKKTAIPEALNKCSPLEANDIREVTDRFYPKVLKDKPEEQSGFADLVRWIYECGYRNGVKDTVQSFVKDADLTPKTDMETYFEAYKNLSKKLWPEDSAEEKDRSL